jgi:hypothetical protein
MDPLLPSPLSRLTPELKAIIVQFVADQDKEDRLFIPTPIVTSDAFAQAAAQDFPSGGAWETDSNGYEEDPGSPARSDASYVQFSDGKGSSDRDEDDEEELEDDEVDGTSGRGDGMGPAQRLGASLNALFLVDREFSRLSAPLLFNVRLRSGLLLWFITYALGYRSTALDPDAAATCATPCSTLEANSFKSSTFNRHQARPYKQTLKTEIIGERVPHEFLPSSISCRTSRPSSSPTPTPAFAIKSPSSGSSAACSAT